jgi:Phosphoribosyl-ATP pyrophosphohydrolase
MTTIPPTTDDTKAEPNYGAHAAGATLWRETMPPPRGAVRLTEDADWDAIATWCCGEHHLREQGDSGEYESVLTVMTHSYGIVDAIEGDWIIWERRGFAVWEHGAFTANHQPAEAPPSASPEQMLREFHSSKAIHGGLMPERPTADIPDWVRDLRVALLVEEVGELVDAAMRGDLEKIADGIGDVIYVAAGTAVAYGIPLTAVLAEIHKSNMTKVNTPDEAKLVKGPGYEPPDIAGVLAEARTRVALHSGAPCLGCGQLREAHTRPDGQEMRCPDGRLTPFMPAEATHA